MYVSREQSRVVKVIFHIIIILAFSKITYAQDNAGHTGWWGNIEAGIGYVGLSIQEHKETDPHFYLGFSGGYSINPDFLIGVELSGWLFEGSNLQNPYEGDGISQVFAIIRYYPLKTKNFFTKIGGGYVSHWNNHAGMTETKEGWGLALGAGYDFAMKSYLSLTPFLTYNYGDLKDQQHSAVSFGIGVTFH